MYTDLTFAFLFFVFRPLGSPWASTWLTAFATGIHEARNTSFGPAWLPFSIFFGTVYVIILLFVGPTFFLR